MIENILDLEKLEEKIPDPDDNGSVKDLPLISEKDSVSNKLNTNKYKNKPLLDLPLLNPDSGESKKERPRIKFNIMNDDESEDNDSLRHSVYYSNTIYKCANSYWNTGRKTRLTDGNRMYRRGNSSGISGKKIRRLYRWLTAAE